MVGQSDTYKVVDNETTESDDQLSANQQSVSDTVSHDNISANQQNKDKPCDQAFHNEEPIRNEQEKQKAPDGGWGWFVVLGACLVHIVMGGFERSNGVLFLQLMSRYKRSAMETSWVLSLFSTLRLSMGPLASALCNKFSCRIVVMIGAAISSAGVLISAFVPDLPYLYITYGVLGGIGRAFTYTPSLIIVGYYFNKKRGIAVGLSTSGVGFGCFIFPPIVEILFNSYGFTGTFIILSAVMSNFFVCSALFRPLELHREFMEYDRKKTDLMVAMTTGEPAEHLLHPVTMTTGQQEEPLLHPATMTTRTQNLLSSQSAAKLSSSIDIIANMKIVSKESLFFQRKLSRLNFAGKGSEKSRKKRQPLLELSLFKNFAFSALCIQIFLFTLSFNSTFVFLPALAEEKGIDPLEGAYLISILGIFDAVSRIIMSAVLDLKRVKPYRLLIYNGVMFLVAIVSLMMPLMKTFWQFSIVSGLYGMLSGTYISQKSVVIVDILGVESLSSSFGLLLMFQGLSGLVGPTVGGMFKDLLGTYDMAFYFGSVGIVAGGITMAAGMSGYIDRRKKWRNNTGTHRNYNWGEYGIALTCITQHQH